MAEILLPQPLRPRQLLSSWRRRLPFFCSFLCYVLFIYKFSLQSHRYNSDSGISTHSISATKNIYSSYEGDSTGVHHGGGGGFTVIGPLHDQTLQWNFSVHRPWMDNAFAFSNGNSNEHEATPPAQLILTDYGFNHPDQAIGLTFPRTMRERELIQGFINHPWFVPVDWTRLNAAVLKRIAKRFTQNSGNARNESATSYNWMVEGETEDDGIPYYFQHSHHTSNSSQTKTSLPHQNHINYYKLQHPHSGIRYYILLDQSTCPERHYPIYGGIERNQDAISNRSTDKDAKSCSMGCDNIDKILNSPFVRYFGEYAHLVIWECSSKFRSIKKFDSYREGAVIVDRPPQQQESEQRDNTLGDTNVQNLFREEQKKRRIDNILFATLSSFHRDINPFLDQGLAPPPIKRAKLTKEQREAITSASCGNASIDSVARYDHQNNNNEHNQNNIQKPYFFTFIGSLGSDRDRRHRDDKPVYQPPNFHARTHLKPLHDPSKGIIILEGQQFQNQFTDSDNPQRRNMTYIDLLTQSHYGGSPRGHAKYTYRFTEILSAGAIPVVIADDWVLPFRPELVDWRECAVFVPEKNTLNTVEVLEGISEEETCRRHKACWRIYERWLDGAEREVEGLIEGWERVFGGNSGDGSWMKGSEEFGGVKCGYDDKECNFT